ncbi:hypothetical protein [Alkalithermobacter paradoxus]|uniref:Uncharacterized protein n=1 Tax=Alkalithermobacter paradoxus TaxID=29349 RepID=A0A1V4I3R9_9FIRM|nr:hypothetical protein CLOTH_20680 [[Clostridium] thermoalcaliphilum]
MKKQTNKILIILLLICILAFIQIGGNIRLYNNAKTHFVSSATHKVYSVSVNLGLALSRSDETFDAAIGATRIYLAELVEHFRITDYALRYNVLWKEHYFLEGLGDAYMAITFVQDKFESIYQKHINGDELDESDFTYLSELKDALDELCNSLRNEDGSLKEKATKSSYFVERFNKFITAIYIKGYVIVD